MKIKIISLTLSGLLLVFGFQNCGKNGFSSNQVSFSVVPDLPEIAALVYGSDARDREYLRKKIEGYDPPTLNEILNQWRRISAGYVYNSVSSIDHEALDTSQYGCVTEILSTGLWAVNEGGVKPSFDAYCISQAWFSALSWQFSDNRLKHATNSSNFNGFISNVKLDRYRHQAILTSLNHDDDYIAIIIAAKVDDQGAIHTLSAERTQSPEKNWYLAYKMFPKNAPYNSPAKVFKNFGEIAIGQSNTNDNGNTTENEAKGDGKGWSGRKTLVKIERDGNLITAHTSDWGASTSLDSSLVVVPGSKIEIDLADAALGLEIFQGEQHYGYGIRSQAQSQIYNVQFSPLNAEQYVYDLMNDLVYEYNSTTGGYDLRPGLSAYAMLGTPRKVGNYETQRVYRITQNKEHTEVVE